MSKEKGSKPAGSLRNAATHPVETQTLDQNRVQVTSVSTSYGMPQLDRGVVYGAKNEKK